MTAPLYAVYAAQAWLRNNSPLTFVRLLGDEDPQKETAGAAGWFTRNTDGDFVGNDAGGGGAYGLFICPSSSMVTTTSPSTTSVVGANPVTGALVAIWYFNSGSITLSGSSPGSADPAYGGDGAATSSIGLLIDSKSGEKAWKAQIWSGSPATLQETISFSLSRTSDRYIRKVFNTSPSNTNSRITANTKSYFLGESYDRHSYESYITGSQGALSNGTPSTTAFGVILPLKLSDNSAIEQADHRKASQEAQTGWYFSQDLASMEKATDINDRTNANAYLASNMQKLFKFHGLSGGGWLTRNIKISIANIRKSSLSSNPFGTFSVILRRIEDIDSAMQVVERFDNCSINPNAQNYVSRVIGDKYLTWDTTNNRYIENGDFTNNSKFIRTEVNPDVAEGNIEDKRLLPFGVYGPPRWRAIQWSSGSAGVALGDNGGSVGTTYFAMSASNTSVCATAGRPDPVELGAHGGPAGKALIGYLIGAEGAPVAFTASFEFPRIYCRVSSSDGSNQSPSSVFWGANTSRGAQGYGVYDESTADVLRTLPASVDDFTAGPTSNREYSYVFSLDDVTQSGSADVTPNALYLSGSRADGISITALTGTWESVLDAGFDQFTTVMNGGNDGLDIYEKEPFNNKAALAGASTEQNSYAYYSVKKALNTLTDAEVVEYNLSAMPGITNAALNDYMVSLNEDRGDSLSVVDLPSVYAPAVDNGTAGASRYGNNPDQAIAALKNRGLNSSYACAYYPWVQIRDTINGRTLWGPPSIAALGTFSSSEKKSQLWFAPAGFNRGGLTEGAAGIPVIGVREKLTSKQRDTLYDANINPIASFPAEGVVIFGQKTLQLTPSALDRINVRRLMIFVKKQISRMANELLFDQNVQATWNRFLAQVNPFLEGIRSDYGLTDFKVVLDETTTTPELIDRNILYAKIFLKPARAIEYIAIDFNISNTGAAFED